MWFSFWKSRDRFSLDELRYLTDQLIKLQTVNEVNKDFVVEALRSIAELITYGDQHDSAFFEFFMEKQVMGEFVRILKVSRTVTVSLQLLQTISIMIQNLKNEHAIYYMFSNEHMNYLITYSFDFQNEELLSYYISFLRAISGKLDRNTISLLVKTQNDEVVSFPLYDEAIHFASHEESMVRTAIRALTLNVYHVGDESVNRYVTSAPHADYFSNLVKFFRRQCINLNALVSDSTKNPGAESADTTTLISTAVDEIEDNLYYFSDVISAGIPDVEWLITDNILQLLIFPLLLPSLTIKAVEGIQIGAATSLYLVCCILRIVKIKDLANTISTALFCPLDAFSPESGAKPNGHTSFYGFAHESQPPGSNTKEGVGILRVDVPNESSSPHIHPVDVTRENDYCDSHLSLREALIYYIMSGDDIEVAGSLSVLATLLQTKELDESMLDALGILPQRKQHKKLLLQALVGEVSGEEQLFSSERSSSKDGTECGSELDSCLQKLKEQFGLLCSSLEVRTSPQVHRFQVLDALVSLFCRSNISAETLWDGGWLLRQLLPYSESEFNSHLKDSYKNCTSALLKETRGVWPDLLVTVLCDEWKLCKRAIEASSPRKEPKCILLSSQRFLSEDGITSDSSFAAGERMCELVKVFVLLHQLQIFSLGRTFPEKPPINPPADVFENSRARSAGLDAAGPKLGTELTLVDAVPCRIAFERGKERHFSFLAISLGTSGWVVLAEELPLKEPYGVVRMVAPLAGSNFILVSSTRFFLLKPKPDDKHSRWLHLRIRPSTLPFVEPAKYGAYGKSKTKALVDGRWTLAFRDEESCNTALSMVLEEINLQSNEVERRLKALLDLKSLVESSNSSQGPRTSSFHSTLSNSF
ncbi:protein TRANSPARENT TESTA 9 isoform X2 [Pyrus x bretschneideri]|uniref:protein TRANSPARENT TESTA 9 isoform X2 n=1 Tax=Pyrus x bretschneideri TaxID=225117 RepID=UPI00202FA16F|nr:protein TRANSPARENT TESTA 9 isoform X2 [Pyrus x bretschneideri]